MGGVISGDAARMIIDRFDILNDNIRELIEAVKVSGGGPAAVNVAGMERLLLESLVAASLPSAPRDTHPITVGILETVLAENESQALLGVEITNDDPAQPLWIGNKGVLVASGRVVRPQETVTKVLPIGKTVYGICVLATISVRVSEAFDLYAIVVR